MIPALPSTKTTRYGTPSGPIYRRCDRSRAARKASGIRRLDASVISYRKARSPNFSTGRIASKTSKRYSSSCGSCTVGSSSPEWVYRPRPLRFRSPSRTSLVKAKVIADRLASGMEVTISRAATGRRAAVTYSYTRWMIDFVSWMTSDGPLIVTLILLPIGECCSSAREEAWR